MTPHADDPSTPANGRYNGPYKGHQTIGHANNGVRHAPLSGGKSRSHLRYTAETELHDLVCVGFGPASLAIAVALHDAVDGAEGASGLPSLHGSPPKVVFLEKQPQFAWHAGMLLEGAKMQITFLKDMATLRNPRSEFTFINYLHKNNRLVDFTNLSTFLPQRVEYEDYMRWCSKWFDEVVSYSQEVVEVLPEKTTKGEHSVPSFTVVSRNINTGETTTRRTRHVVIATGGRPQIPRSLPQSHPRVIHSSQYSLTIPRIFRDPQHPYRFAIIGGGQSAAEIFENLNSHYPNSTTRLLIKHSALRPSDDSPFVNEIFNPSRVNDFYKQSASIRAASIAEDRNTNYGVVRLELLERIYEELYIQRIRYASEEDWPRRILPHRTVTAIDDSPVRKGGVRLHVHNESGNFLVDGALGDEVMDVDAVLVASGYRRDAHEDILQNARHLMPGGDRPDNNWTVGRDYRVEFEKGAVASDAGVWLQGCCESTHGLSDTLLSILACRAGHLVDSIFGSAVNDGDAILEGNGVNGHAETNGVNGHVETNGMALTNGVH
ncbi:hypothetical protein W97_04088 [Coniosporium apollinis CBS 100218]|uniref:L-ornithine N(5)-monooxygenase n=1 Tax=Coniosporium apollinis (strain CBS 100218) TaxID=1168221 RepID=R7YSQ1_CONA1|nr:uncharacterized protein W97_04088 [Coniosporium apollinis CBS 100218]EON64854.1 hypothetical protein W97_04088 [Coniosporium apollinis CBS 100218]